MNSGRSSCAVMVLALLLVDGRLPAPCAPPEQKNWLRKAVPGVGTFEKTEPVAYPWGGVDTQGFLRKSVALPAVNPFVTKSNQFSYAWMGSSASFVDMDGDGLPEIVSPDGAGIFWCWKNTGSPGKPSFDRGEAMPLLVDDLRSQFAPIIQIPENKNESEQKNKLTPSQQADKRRIDEKRAKELDKMAKKNRRLDKDDQQSDEELAKAVAKIHPYPWEQEEEEAASVPKGRLLPGGAIPPEGLSCTLNSFRRLRAIAAPCDWNGDKLTDFIVGDSGGTVYFARNTGKPGQPHYSYTSRATDSVPLKTVLIPAGRGKAETYRPVEFMNYAMPFVCDWDGNGTPDLLVGEGTYSVNSIRLFRDASRATPQNPPREEALYIGDERTFLAPFAYDWDGDGDLDLFVCDDRGNLTVHRRAGTPAVLEEPQPMRMDGGNQLLAYCTPQPCDWNNDGVMDLIWGEPFGRIMVALGKEKGGMNFSAPEAVRSVRPAETIQFPVYGSLAGTPARVKDSSGGSRNGGTASAERYYRADGTTRENQGGWHNDQHNKMYGLLPSWPADPPRTLQMDVFNRDGIGATKGKQPSWAVAPLPGDVWEVVSDAPDAPGAGKTLLLRWHDTSKNAIFRTRTAALPQWTPGCAVFFSDGNTGPFASQYTPNPITIRFHMKLTGKFTRLDMTFNTSWGPLGKNGKPPEEGGSFTKTLTSPPSGSWFEFSHTEQPGGKHQRGLDGNLFIGLLGEGEVRIRDVRVTEGN